MLGFARKTWQSIGMANWTQAAVDNLAAAVAGRRSHLGRSQLDSWRRGGPSNSTMTSIEKAASRSVTTATLKKLDMGLDWVPGTAIGVLRGEILPNVAAHDPRYDLDYQHSQQPDGMRFNGTVSDIDEQPLQSIDVTRGGVEGLRNHMLRSKIMKKQESDRTAEEIAFVGAFDAAHPRRLDPAIWPAGEYRTPEAIFDDWQRARNSMLNRTLEYAHVRGTRFELAEDELKHVLRMAAEVQGGSGRPWTPPWDPGPEYLVGDEPWKAEWWVSSEEVDAGHLATEFEGNKINRVSISTGWDPERVRAFHAAQGDEWAPDAAVAGTELDTPQKVSPDVAWTSSEVDSTARRLAAKLDDEVLSILRDQQTIDPSIDFVNQYLRQRQALDSVLDTPAGQLAHLRLAESILQDAGEKLKASEIAQNYGQFTDVDDTDIDPAAGSGGMLRAARTAPPDYRKGRGEQGDAAGEESQDAP